MTIAQPTDPPLPHGADPDQVEDWETEKSGESTTTSRLVWSTPILPEQAGVGVCVVASQRPDGSIIAEDDIEGPLIYVGNDDYTLGDARMLATALVQAADLADQWAGRRSLATSQLATAKSALLQAYTALRKAPGNAGDYLRAALDSIDDAQAVLR